MDTGVAEHVATGGEGGRAVSSVRAEGTEGGVRGHLDTSRIRLLRRRGV